MPDDSSTRKDRRSTGNFDALSELERVERRLREVEGEWRRDHALASLGLHAAMIAHEFNNLLTPVVTLAQHALSRPEDAALTRRTLERCLLNSQRAARISQAILSFAKGDVEQSTGSASVHRAVRDAIECMGRDPARDGVTVEIKGPAIRLRGMSETLLSQILLNLIQNALSSMRPGGGVLTITTSTCNTSPAIEITDTGKGMTPQRLHAIAVPLRGDGVGHGVGLAFCRHALAQVGADLVVSSAEGRGTTVSIQLPSHLVVADEGDVLRGDGQND